MQFADDNSLLRQYADEASEEAFATLVTRHVNLVYSVALRQTGSPQQAEEITQAVFILLARKAGVLHRRMVLSSWLFQAARFTAKNYVRSESRRLHREQEAYMQSVLDQSGGETWRRISPLLDEAVAALSEKDRQAIISRFFEGRNLAQVGVTLNISNEAAEKRVTRALEKMRKFFFKRGLTLSTAVIAECVTEHSVQAGPSTLAKATTLLALSKTTSASGAHITLTKGVIKLMAWTKAKTAVFTTAAILLTAGTTTVVVDKVMAARPAAIYEDIFRHPDSSSGRKLETAPPTLIVRPTRYSGKDGGIWTPRGKGVYVNATLKDLIGWAYQYDPARIILPPDAPTGNYDYLATLPRQQSEALREEIKKQFGLVAKEERRETDIIVMRDNDLAKLNSFRTHGGQFACYGEGRENTQTRYMTNASLSLLAMQIVEGYFEKPCIDRTDPKAKYDLMLQWREPKDLKGEARLEALRPVIIEELNRIGLELVDRREEIQMLIVEKTN